MGTRSNIGLEEPDGTLLFIYCHYDGSPWWNGAVLLKHYSDESKLRDLLNRGDLRFLHFNLDPVGDETTCQFFAPSPDSKRVYANRRDAMITQEWAYLWSVPEQEWYYHDNNPGSDWKPVRDNLAVQQTLRDGKV